MSIKIALTSLIFLVLGLLAPAFLNPYTTPSWVQCTIIGTIIVSGLGLLTSLLMVIWL